MLGSSDATSPSVMRHVARSKSSSTWHKTTAASTRAKNAHCDDQSAAGTQNDAMNQESKDSEAPCQASGLHSTLALCELALLQQAESQLHASRSPRRSGATAPTPPTHRPPTRHAEPSQRRRENPRRAAASDLLRPLRPPTRALAQGGAREAGTHTHTQREMDGGSSG